MTSHPKRLPDHRKRRIEIPKNYRTTGWLLVLVIATFCVVMVLKWYLK